VSRYNLDDEDLIERIKRLERRISVLERTPQTANAGVNQAGITIKGGSFDVIRDDESTEGHISIGSNVTLGGVGGSEVGMAIIVNRHDEVTSSRSDSDGNTLNGRNSVLIQTIDGSTVSPDFRFPTIQLLDKTGDTIFADTWNARQGMSEPRLMYTVYGVSYNTTTSGSFTDIGMVDWYMYHPHLQFNILVQNDVGTTGEIRVHSENDGTDKIIYTTASGAFDYEFFRIKRSQMSFGIGSPNGNVETLTISHRRTSGAGTARFKINSVVGKDGSRAPSWQRLQSYGHCSCS
jgi:hypothetical protein